MIIWDNNKQDLKSNKTSEIITFNFNFHLWSNIRQEKIKRKWKTMESR
jgi:hypothetical protein